MTCYFQGCSAKGTTKEHIPPRSFFPDGEKEQLLTVRSCEKHNNAKSVDDLYVLAQICMNASPSNRAGEVWESKIVPQLAFNNGAFQKRLAAGSRRLPDGAVKYRVEIARMDEFFSALSCGILYKTCRTPLPQNYNIAHVYHNFTGHSDPAMLAIESGIEKFYSGKPLDFMSFGEPGTKNENIYNVTVFGIPDYQSSITIVHVFFGVFKVTSMLTRTLT